MYFLHLLVVAYLMSISTPPTVQVGQLVTPLTNDNVGS